MESHITASEGGESGRLLCDGYLAVIQTKSCLVFQVKSDVKSENK